MNPRDRKEVKRLKNAAKVAIFNQRNAERQLKTFKETLRPNRMFLTWTNCIIGRVNKHGDLTPLMKLDINLGYSRKEALDLAEKHNCEVIFWDKALKKIISRCATTRNDLTQKIKEIYARR